MNPDPDQPPSYPPPQDPYHTGEGFPPPLSGPPTAPQAPPLSGAPTVQQPAPLSGAPTIHLPPPVPGPVAPAPARSRFATSHLVLLAVAAVAVVGMLVAGGVAVWVVSRPDPSAPVTPSLPPDAVEGLAVGAGPVRVDVYVDYQCAPCARFEELTGDSLTTYLAADRVTLNIHPVAFTDRRSTNEYSTRSAAAVACAHEQGKTLEFHSYLLSHQPGENTAGPTDRELAIAGHALGLGADWDYCIAEGRKRAWVNDATAAAHANGVETVPAVLVNDHPVKATKSDLVTAIDRAR
ncbi:thioredoxin domain-containing protein [Actinoplanes sp. NPDC051470]|uniref:DsbA family protein n=1 Tax=unclassified Actinoplanes TaxID=2626549 RepID=UPI003444542A